jgi:hypothetical protein
MSSSSKYNKRTLAYHELGQAAKELGKKIISTGEALVVLGKALEHVKQAEGIAKPHTLRWKDEKGSHVKVQRDGLPQHIRVQIQALLARTEKLRDQVKAIPVTKEERVLAEDKKAKARIERKEQGSANKRPN